MDKKWKIRKKEWQYNLRHYYINHILITKWTNIGYLKKE